MPLPAGHKLGPYEILGPIGAGGMGEVYKARDTRLDRTVAIKVLPEHIARRGDARARFEREARAVASLNHPHICTLHDIGDGFMVMELIDGETLAARIAKGPVPLEPALKIAIQIADALDRAHRAGVTHRDIKPQNIMLTRDGVKVLDFGLAKSATRNPGPTEETLTEVLTGEGTVLGTPQYMAPEQFEGKEADARCDVWAFGAVLYEMVTGQRAFQGKTYASMVGAILSADPAPMVIKPLTPPWLERLVRRCLEKDPERRFQSIRDLVLELEAPPRDPVPPAPVGQRWRWTLAALLLGVAASCAFFLTRAPRPSGRQLSRMTRLTFDQKSFEAALSPDGKLAAYQSYRTGNTEIWVQQVSGGAPVRLTDHPAFDGHPVFSADGSKIYFSSLREPAGVYEIPALGGEARLFAERADNAEASPDGQWIAYIRDNRIRIRPAAGGEERTLAEDVLSPAREMFQYLVWSPDSKRILGPGGNREKGLAPDWYVFGVGGEAARPTGLLSNLAARKMLLTAQNHVAAWLPGDEILFSAPSGDAVNLWSLPAAALAHGTPRAVTSGAFQNIPIRVTGNRAIFATRNVRQEIWSLPADLDRGIIKGEPRPLVTAGGRHQFPDIGPDGSLLSFVRYSTRHDLFLRTLPSGNERSLPVPPTASHPVLSPDSTQVAYMAGYEPDWALHTIPAAGGQPKVLNREARGRPRGWSPDGRYIILWSTAAGGGVIAVDAESGKAKKILFSPRRNIAFPRLSPDGRWIAAVEIHGTTAQTSVLLAPFRGDQAIPETEWVTVAKQASHPVWPPDGRSLYWIQRTNGMAELIRGQFDPVSGTVRGAPVPAYRFASFNFRDLITNTPKAARDQLVYTISEADSDIWVMDWTVE